MTQLFYSLLKLIRDENKPPHHRETARLYCGGKMTDFCNELTLYDVCIGQYD